MSGPSSSNYGVVIVGGGPAGASAAIHLAARGVRVLLVEQKKFPRAKLCGEFISPECLDHFARLGVADRMMKAGGARLSETIFYARSGSSISVPSEWFGARGEALGLSRAEMDHRLLRRAHDAGADALEDAQATGLIIEGGRVRGVRLRASGEEFECGSLVVVDATGRRRALARDVEREENNGRHARRKRRASLVAFKTHLEGARGAEGGCEIYSYRGGYGGLSRVEGGLSNLCFIASARDVRACGSDPEKVLREVLMTNRRAAYTLDRARPASQWLSVALESFGRRTVVPADGLLAVGDAASFIDPFTGSGILMALESGELAADVIARWLPRISEGEPFGPLACEYRALYYERFKTRLRVCTLLRRAAFVPGLAEVVISTLGASERVRRRLARATRRASLRAARDAAG